MESIPTAFVWSGQRYQHGENSSPAVTDRGRGTRALERHLREFCSNPSPEQLVGFLATQGLLTNDEVDLVGLKPTRTLKMKFLADVLRDKSCWWPTLMEFLRVTGAEVLRNKLEAEYLAITD